MSVYRFNAHLPFGLKLLTPIPIYDDYGNLIGGASIFEFNIVKFFVARSGYPTALALTSNSGVWVNFQDKDGEVQSAILTDRPVSLNAVYSQANNEDSNED